MIESLKSPKSIRMRCRAILLASVTGFFLFPSLMVVNFFMAVSLLFRPFFRVSVQRFNCLMADTWWGWVVLVSQKVNRVRLVVSGDDLPNNENAILVVNHQSMADVIVMLEIAKLKNCLGDLKFFVKDILKYVPGVGWGMLILGFPFIKRHWEKDERLIRECFSVIKKNRLPFWLGCFAEGTRLRPHKLKKSQAYAEKMGYFKPRHVLVPRTKGFTLAVSSLKDQTSAIYDMTIGYTPALPSLGQLICGYVYEIHLHIKRFKLKDIGADSQAQSAWLMQRFAAKDELLDGFYKNGHF